MIAAATTAPTSEGTTTLKSTKNAPMCLRAVIRHASERPPRIEPVDLDFHTQNQAISNEFFRDFGAKQA
jgi:hypothetical protein